MNELAETNTELNSHQKKERNIMINLIGKWNIVETLQYNEKAGSMDWVKAEDYIAQDDLDREMAAMLTYQVLFEEDGSFGFLMPMPEDISQEAERRHVTRRQASLESGKRKELCGHRP